MSLLPKRCRAVSNLLRPRRGKVLGADEQAETIRMAPAAWATGMGSKKVRSRIGTILWVLATIVVASWGAATALQVRPEPPGSGHSAPNLAPQAPPAHSSVLPRGIPRVVASEAHRQKPVRGHDGTSFGIIPEEVPLPLVAYQGFAPILRSSAWWSGLVRAFEPRGPPSLIA
jgi:hypothetical protein